MLQGWDDTFYYVWLPSVVIDRDLDFANQLRQSQTISDDLFATIDALPRTPVGLPENKYPPGWALGSLPFFLGVRLFAPPQSTGYEANYLIAVTLGQMLYAAVGLGFAIAILRRYFPTPVAAAAVFIGWLASPLVYYQSARLTMAHSQVFTVAMAVLWLSLRLSDGETRTRFWAALGFCAALLATTRNVNFVYLTLPVWIAAYRLRSWRNLAGLLAGAALPATVQLLAWKLLYGSWLVYSYGGERFDLHHLHLREVLFSARHGWFYWHPLLLPAIIAFLIWAWKRSEGRAWLVSLGAIVVLGAAWPTWWLGSSFGYRGFEVATLFAMIGLATLWQACSRRTWLRRLAVVGTSVAIVWNLLLLALFLTQRISRNDPVSYFDVLRSLLG